MDDKEKCKADHDYHLGTTYANKREEPFLFCRACGKVKWLVLNSPDQPA